MALTTRAVADAGCISIMVECESDLAPHPDAMDSQTRHTADFAIRLVSAMVERGIMPVIVYDDPAVDVEALEGLEAVVAPDDTD